MKPFAELWVPEYGDGSFGKAVSVKVKTTHIYYTEPVRWRRYELAPEKKEKRRGKRD